MIKKKNLVLNYVLRTLKMTDKSKRQKKILKKQQVEICTIKENYGSPFKKTILSFMCLGWILDVSWIISFNLHLSR